MNILNGQRILEKRNSKINGELTVIKDIFFGTYIMGGRLPQSGGLALFIWKTTLNEINHTTPRLRVAGKNNLDIKSCLIIGLGGGGIAKLVRERWKNSKITGVDVDEVIVKLGKKYLSLDKYNVEIFIEDAETYVNRLLQNNIKYNLICIDTYIGDEFPKKFASEKFAKKVKRLMSKNGIIIFNRLYGKEDEDTSKKFGKILDKIFKNVERVYPEANVMFVCM